MFATVTPIIPQPSAAFVVLDLETGNAPTQAIAAAMEEWKAPGNWKPDTVAAKRREAAEKIIEKAALLDASPILCVAIQTDRTRLILNGMDASAPEIDGWPVMPCGDERGLIQALRFWLDTNTTAETTVVGHNIRAFDLPKLRHAYVRHSLRLPEILKPRLRDENKAETVDTASLFKAFSMEHRDDFCPSLDTVAASFGIPRPKQHMSGAECPRLFQDGQIATVLTYCAVDVATTTRAYQLMTANAPDLD
ncbi:MAG: ribonuclease H-like domain-containing protein [Candidatus Contendobacter sp.]